MRRTLVIVLLLILLPLATFGRVLGHGFVDWDDQGQLYENPDFNPPTPAKIARYWRGPHMNLYMPVSYTLWGVISSVARLDAPDPSGATLDARWFHATNLLLHIVSTLAVFAILRTLRIDPIPAAIGAAVFAVHPVMVEPVAWASATYTVLSGMFSMLALWAYLKHSRADAQGGPRRWGLLFIATIALLLAMLSKPSAVVVPVIAAALDLLLVRGPGRRALLTAAAWLLVALPFMILARSFQPAAWVEGVPLWQRPIIAADALAFYAAKILFPLRLAADYGRFPQRVMGSELRYVTWVVPALLVAGAWLLRRRAPWFAAGLIAFVAGLGAYLGLVKFDFQYWSTVADRYLYVSMLGVALWVGHALSALRSRRRNVACLLATLVVLALAVRSSLQAKVWRDTQTLFAHTLEVNGDSVIAHNSLGYLAARQGRSDQAMRHYRAVLRVKPRDGGANFNLANALLAGGDLPAAIAHYRVAAESKPPNALIYNNLGVALARSGRLDEAEQAFAQALRIDPRLEMARQGIERVRVDRAATTRP